MVLFMICVTSKDRPMAPDLRKRFKRFAQYNRQERILKLQNLTVEESVKITEMLIESRATYKIWHRPERPYIALTELIRSKQVK